MMSPGGGRVGGGSPFRARTGDELPPLVANADRPIGDLSGDPFALAALLIAWGPWLDREGRLPCP